MLVHICCSVDSHYFLSELQKLYPKEKITGFFYNPNIHPKSEHDLRLLDVKRSCEMLGIELLEGKYDDKEWCEGVRGLEDEPEKGERCSVCFDTRLLESARLAKELGEKTFSTTLLSSPMKTQQVLFEQGDKIAEKYGLDFVKIDVRSNGGTQKQNELSKQDNLYRQNYCGCKFALQKQREKQERFPLEFISPINQQVMPGSIEYRNRVFERRNQLEKEGKPYLLTQQNQIVWRCLNAKLEHFKEVVWCHILAHSKAKKNLRMGSLFWGIPQALKGVLKKGSLGYSKKDESLFLTLAGLNEIMQTQYQRIQDMFKNPLSYAQELYLRRVLTEDQSLCPIVIIQEEIVEDLRLHIESFFQEEKVFELIEF